jgi:hypothetical protein
LRVLVCEIVASKKSGVSPSVMRRSQLGVQL